MAPRPKPSDEQSDRAVILDQLMQSDRASLLKLARLHSHRDADAEDAVSEAAVQFLRFYSGPPGARALHWMKLVTKRCAWQIRARAETAGLSSALVRDLAAWRKVCRTGIQALGLMSSFHEG